MGMPSVGIYTYELFHFYGVEQIIRIGSAGGLSDDVRVHDLVMGMGACTDSNYASQFGLPGAFAPVAGSRVNATPVPDTLFRLPNTMGITLTAVPQE